MQENVRCLPEPLIRNLFLTLFWQSSPMSIKVSIAKAIKRADRSYFFEDYTKQAEAVLMGLKQDGFAIIPREPEESVLKQVADTMPVGKMKPEKHIQDVLNTLISITRNRELR